MKCPACGCVTRVMQSRQKDGAVHRRRKCRKKHLSYTLETFVVFEKKAGRPKSPPAPPKPKKPKKLKAKKPPKPKPAPYPPALKEWGLVVTKDSPLWLKSIAMKLER